MTLKEKVAEIQPEELNFRVIGGVMHCPNHYPYLYGSLTKQEIFGVVCGVAVFNEISDCWLCWNRKYIEPEVQDA